jgi:hypothetical protein
MSEAPAEQHPDYDPELDDPDDDASESEGEIFTEPASE